jgi:hypothetical protein
MKAENFYLIAPTELGSESMEWRKTGVLHDWSET